jgi:hypothetical protein
LRCCRLAVVAVVLAISNVRADDKRVGFEVTFAPEVSRGPISGRVYVMLGPGISARAPRFGPDWMKPQPFFAVDAVDWKPAEPLAIGPDAAGFPGAMKDLKPGTYAAQAVVRLNPDTHKLGDGEGNAYGPLVEVKFEPGAEGLTALRIDQIVLLSRSRRRNGSSRLIFPARYSRRSTSGRSASARR